MNLEEIAEKTRIEKRIKKLERLIRKYDTKGERKIIGFLYSRKAYNFRAEKTELEKRLAELKEIEKNTETQSAPSEGFGSERYEENKKTIADKQAELTALANNTTLSDEEKEEQKYNLKRDIRRLELKNGFIVNVRRGMTLPKYFANKLSLKRTSLRYQGRILYNEKQLKKYDKKFDSLKNDKIRDYFKGLYYDFRGNFYKKSSDRAKRFLNELNNPTNKPKVTGKRKINVSNSYGRSQATPQVAFAR